MVRIPTGVFAVIEQKFLPKLFDVLVQDRTDLGTELRLFRQKVTITTATTIGHHVVHLICKWNYNIHLPIQRDP